jgi:hypothetical protein
MAVVRLEGFVRGEHHDIGGLGDTVTACAHLSTARSCTAHTARSCAHRAHQHGAFDGPVLVLMLRSSGWMHLGLIHIPTRLSTPHTHTGILAHACAVAPRLALSWSSFVAGRRRTWGGAHSAASPTRQSQRQAAGTCGTRLPWGRAPRVGWSLAPIRSAPCRNESDARARAQQVEAPSSSCSTTLTPIPSPVTAPHNPSHAATRATRSPMIWHRTTNCLN